MMALQEMAVLNGLMLFIDLLRFHTRQIAKLLKYISINTANGHYSEMAWLPFQKPENETHRRMKQGGERIKRRKETHRKS